MFPAGSAQGQSDGGRGLAKSEQSAQPLGAVGKEEADADLEGRKVNGGDIAGGGRGSGRGDGLGHTGAEEEKEAEEGKQHNKGGPVGEHGRRERPERVGDTLKMAETQNNGWMRGEGFGFRLRPNHPLSSLS